MIPNEIVRAHQKAEEAEAALVEAKRRLEIFERNARHSTVYYEKIYNASNETKRKLESERAYMAVKLEDGTDWYTHLDDVREAELRLNILQREIDTYRWLHQGRATSGK